MKKVLVFLVLAMVVLGSCSNKQNIVGTWIDIEGITWVFDSDGKLKYENSPGDIREYRYSVTDNKLIIFEVTSTYWIVVNYVDQTYDISFSGKTLMLTGGKDLDGWNTAGPGWSKNQLNRTSARSQKAEVDKKLNGTWIGDFEEDGEKWKEELKINNGTYEFIIDGVPSIKGTYTTNGGKITARITHYYSEDDSEWIKDNETFTEDYLIEGKTLTLRGEGGEYKYSKK